MPAVSETIAGRDYPRIRSEARLDRPSLERLHAAASGHRENSAADEGHPNTRWWMGRSDSLRAVPKRGTWRLVPPGGVDGEAQEGAGAPVHDNVDAAQAD